MQFFQELHGIPSCAGNDFCGPIERPSTDFRPRVGARILGHVTLPFAHLTGRSFSLMEYVKFHEKFVIPF